MFWYETCLYLKTLLDEASRLMQQVEHLLALLQVRNICASVCVCGRACVCVLWNINKLLEHFKYTLSLPNECNVTSCSFFVDISCPGSSLLLWTDTFVEGGQVLANTFSWSFGSPTPFFLYSEMFSLSSRVLESLKPQSGDYTNVLNYSTKLFWRRKH